MMGSRLASCLLLLLFGVVACDDDPAAPRPATLELTLTPDPAPSIGVATVCEGATAKTWLYTLAIENTGGEPFAVSTWWSSLSSSADFASPVDFPAADSTLFATAFGTATVAPGQSVQRELCHALVIEEAWITYSVSGAAGTFTSQILHLLP